MFKKIQIKRTNTKKIIMAALSASLLFASGCGAVKRELAEPDKDSYVKSAHSLVTVERGDMESSFSISLKGADYEKINYAVDVDTINNGLNDGNLVFDGCYVSLGQYVHKGDLLASYTDKKLDKEIKDYEDKMTENNNLIEHYQELMNIDPDKDYSEEISSIRGNNEVLALYIEEAEIKRDNYRIYAKEDGTISFVYDKMSEYLGYIWEYTGSGKYIIIAESTGENIFSATTEEEYDFKVGDVYEAVSSLNKYRMVVTSVEKTGGATKVSFVPEDENLPLSPDSTFILEVKRPVKKDVVYVNYKAIRYTDDSNAFVYVVDEDGYRHAVMVTIGDRIDANVIILDGLNGGEEVSID